MIRHESLKWIAIIVAIIVTILLALAAVFLIAATLCKPAAVVLPLVALAIDRVALRTAWRTSSVIALAGMACVVPLALVTRSVQDLHLEGASLWWQRPFVAGDALAFYLFKAVWPINLGVEYGRTPPRGRVAWVELPGLGGSGGAARHQPPPSAAPPDRMARLPDVRHVSAAHSGARPLLLSGPFDRRRSLCEAIDHFERTLELEYLRTDRLDAAIGSLKAALSIEPSDAKALNDLGIAFMRSGRAQEGVDAFQRAGAVEPSNPQYRGNLGRALSQLGRTAEARAYLGE